MKAYCVVYRVYHLPEVEAAFQTERELENYCRIWLDYPDIDYVYFFHYDMEYTPEWWN